ncbi:MAG: putative phosphohydrolase [Capsulimonas sp.]|nr:putative phosphohydrolase [Capsulimonas sp.]
MNKSTFVIAALSTLLATPVFAETTKALPPIPTLFTSMAAPADPDHFTFVVSGDNRSTGHGYPMPPSLAQICQEIGTVRPAFTLWTGDAIEGYGDTPAEAEGEYDTFFQSAALARSPIFMAPGNHEFSLDAALLPIYRKRMGPLYGSFDYGSSHFIALNTTPVLPDGKISAGGEIDDAQRAWLEADLKANASAKHIFVFLHHYVFGPPDTGSTIDTGFKSLEARESLHKLFVQSHVSAVFCGHNHLYWHTAHDGVEYYISGGAGAPLDASPEEGGYLHYVVFTVDGDKVTPSILQPWHLLTTYPAGDDKGLTTETAFVENTNHIDVPVHGVVFHIAPPAPGATVTVEAKISYKKSKTVPARIVSSKPSADGKSLEVVVETTLPADRTTEVTVSSAK